MRGIKNFRFGPQVVFLLFFGLFSGWGWEERKGGYLPDSQGVAHYTYVNGEYVPVPYSYNPYPNIGTFHYRNPPVYGGNLDQLQGSTPGLYARPFESKANFFYK